MNTTRNFYVFIVILLLTLAPATAGVFAQSPHIPAGTTAPWWDESSPYRIPVSAGGSGIIGVSVNFTDGF